MMMLQNGGCAFPDNCDHGRLLAAVIAAGEEFKAIHKKLTELFDGGLREQVEALKANVFCVSRGVSGRQVLVQKKLMCWSEFCLFCFGVSSRRINQLLDIEDQEKRTARYEARHEEQKQKEEDAAVLHVEEDDLRMYVNGVAQGPDAQQAEPALELERTLEEVSSNPQYDRQDPYWHFSQFKDQPQTLGTEISGMLLDFGLDLAAIKEVLTIAQKDAKRTLCQTKEEVAQ
jgi:hypothetical protein